MKQIREYSHLEPIATDLFYVLENLWQYIAGWKKVRRDSKKYAANIYVLPFKQKKGVSYCMIIYILQGIRDSLD